MTELSPAAKAVLDAVKAISPAPADEIAAVALRAAADLVVPLRAKTPWGSTVNPSTEALCIHDALYSIAIELDS